MLGPCPSPEYWSLVLQPALLELRLVKAHFDRSNQQ